MSSSSVWVQLYYNGEDKPSGRTVEIEPVPRNINALIKATKTELKPKIDYAPVDEIFIYPPDTEPPFPEQSAIRGDKILKELIDELGGKDPQVSIGYDHPLIVVAPALAPHPPGQGQPQGPLLSEEVIAKMENSICMLIEGGKPFGTGFAVSNRRVYTAAHHWEEEDDDGVTYFAVAEGAEVECIHGKPSANKRYKLQVVRLDKHLDYCILEIIGDHTFTEWLETDVSPNLTLTTTVFLASYQLGIQKYLDDFNMGVSLGIANGIILRRSKRHMVHSCAAFKGDSGGAIVISNGKVIGLHVASVDEAQHLLDVNLVDFGSVADSINQLCDAQSSGSIALLVSAIEPLASYSVASAS